MTRVLVGHFGALVRAGLADLLSDGRLKVTYTGPDDMYVKVMEELPDVVLLDQDAPGSEVIASRRPSAAEAGSRRPQLWSVS